MLTSMGDVMREAHRRGWITTRDGNISVRRGNNFYITPSGWRKTIIHPEHMLKFKVDNLGRLTGDSLNRGNPSGELEMHRLLQTLNYDNKARAVVHLHPTNIIAAMYAGFNLQKLAEEFPEVSRYTKVGPTVRVLPVTSQVLADETFCAMTDVVNKKEVVLAFDIVGQAGHGVCAIASSPWDAFEHIERLEHICQIVLASGVPPK